MIQHELAERQVLRLSVGLGMAQVDIATDEITDALKRASRDAEHAARIVTELLKRPDRLPTPTEIQALARRTDLEFDPREWRCSECNGTGWKPVFELHTWSGPDTKAVQAITREQYDKLQSKVSGIIGEQMFIKLVDDCHCALGRQRVEGRAKDAQEKAEKAAKAGKNSHEKRQRTM
jgi:hypothetical protein